jgi:[acyl-carrier-protein] S-malonyltransferase
MVTDMDAVTGAILFPGQGAQALGMGLDIADSDPSARAIFDTAATVLGTDLREVIAGDDKAALDRTDVCQPAILVTSLAVAAAAEARGVLNPAAVEACAGLSLGEYTALAWAGALQLEDAIRLVRARGEAMQRASDENPSGMLSLVGATEESAAAVCDAARGDGVLVVANILAPGQVAIAGSLDALDRAASILRDHQIRKGVRLPVAGAFHSPCMESAAAALADALAATAFEAPRMPVVMNVTGEPTRDPDQIRDLLQKQITSPVLWKRSMETLLGQGVTQFFEPAPGKQLTNMLRRYEQPQGQEPFATICGDVTQLEALAPWPAPVAATGKAS